jgi:hypothetical protein
MPARPHLNSLPFRVEQLIHFDTVLLGGLNV